MILIKKIAALAACWGLATLGIAQPFAGCPKGNETVKLDEAEMTRIENEMLAQVNALRKQKRLPPLKLDKSLSASARYHSADMAIDGYFDHDSHDKDGSRQCGTFDRINKFTKNKFAAQAENISAGQSDVSEVMEAWRTSPGHKANMLNKKYTHIGVGYYYLKNDKQEYRYYWCQTFGQGK